MAGYGGAPAHDEEDVDRPLLLEERRDLVADEGFAVDREHHVARQQQPVLLRAARSAANHAAHKLDAHALGAAPHRNLDHAVGGARNGQAVHAELRRELAVEPAQRHLGRLERLQRAEQRPKRPAGERLAVDLEHAVLCA